MNYRTLVHVQVFAAILTIFALLFLIPKSTSAASHIEIAFLTMPLYAFPLTISIFIVMWLRGTSQKKIDGFKNLGDKSIPKAFLQNTLEQTFLAILSIMAFAAHAPADLSAIIILSAWLFVIGRALFLMGYYISPMWRFYGFSLNFYMSTTLLLLSMYYMFFE